MSEKACKASFFQNAILYSIVIVGSCRTVDATSPCQLPYSQVLFNSNKKSTDVTLFKLYQTDRQQSR